MKWSLSCGSKPKPELKNVRRGAALSIPTAFVLVLALFALSACGVAQSDTQEPASPPPAALVTAQDYLAQGDYHFDRKDYNAAIADYSHAIELKPDFAEAYNNRAYTYMTKEDYAHALPDLNQALVLRPNYVNALLNRGDIHNYYYQIDYKRAVADYDRVLALDPNAAHNTSVCGHRMLAAHHGWNLGVVPEIAAYGITRGCN